MNHYVHPKKAKPGTLCWAGADDLMLVVGVIKRKPSEGLNQMIFLIVTSEKQVYLWTWEFTDLSSLCEKDDLICL